MPPKTGPLWRRLLVRVFAGVLSVLFVALVTFLADEIAPGDGALARAGEKASVETINRIRAEMGLDRPWPVRFVEYVGNAARGDLGNSYFGAQEPVTAVLGRSVPMTAKLAGFAILLAVGVALVLGCVAAVYENRWPDRLALGVSTLGVTVPNFVLIPLLVLVFVLNLDLFPLTWEDPLRGPEFYYLVLPVVVLAMRPMAILTRLTRASMIEALGMEFMRFARAKGVPLRARVLKHGLRNALPPIVTSVGTSFGFLLTGSFITETAFAIPGLGKAAIDAIERRDTPLILGTTLVAAVLYIVVNLIVDLIQPLLDPRLKEAQV